MKKPALIAAIAVPVLLAYPAASWVLGTQIESALSDQYKQIESMPYVKVVERKFERGVFASTEVVTFEVMGDMFRSLEKARKTARAEAAAADPEAAKTAPAPLQPLRFTVRSEIKHGPLPGMSALAAATSDSELVLDATTQQELARLIGDKKPLTAHTVYRFDGGGSSDVASPAFAASFPGVEPDTVNRMSWEGFTAKVDFARGMQSYTIAGDAPKLEILDGKGVAVVMAGLKFDGDAKRLFDDEPLLYAGTQHFTLAQMSVADKSGKTPPVQFKQVAYDIAMPAAGEFVDVVAKMGAEGVQIGEQNYGPAHYDFSVRHLHARSVANFYRAMLKMYGDPAALAAAGDPTRAFAALSEPGKELLVRNPEFRIDRLSFKTPQGEAAVSASAKLNDAKPEDLANPMMLIAKLEASADLALPESLLGNMPGGAMRAVGEEADPEMAAMQARMLEQQLAGFAEQGYITRADGVVKSKIVFRSGQLSVNGKPFNPMAMRGPGAAPADRALEERQVMPAPKM